MIHVLCIAAGIALGVILTRVLEGRIAQEKRSVAFWREIARFEDNREAFLDSIMSGKEVRYPWPPLPHQHGSE